MDEVVAEEVLAVAAAEVVDVVAEAVVLDVSNNICEFWVCFDL